MTVPSEWRAFADALRFRETPQIVYVLGGVDTGKTTLCHFLQDHFAAFRAVAYIDCDPGQSSLGPPTTVGMMIYHRDKPLMERPLLRFIGATTPVGHLLPTLTAIKRLTDKAREFHAELVVLDSSGLALGDVAREFQFHVIDLLRPHHIVAIQRRSELEPILRNFLAHPRIRVHRFAVTRYVIERLPPERRLYREQRFQAYFQEARLWDLRLDRIGMRGRLPAGHDSQAVRHRLIALCDCDHFVVTLGIVVDYQPEAQTMRFYAPPFETQKVAAIHFGSIFLDRSGQQLLLPKRLSTYATKRPPVDESQQPLEGEQTSDESYDT